VLRPRLRARGEEEALQTFQQVSYTPGLHKRSHAHTNQSAYPLDAPHHQRHGPLRPQRRAVLGAVVREVR
jgi:hypothetical protein